MDLGSIWISGSSSPAQSFCFRWWSRGQKGHSGEKGRMKGQRNLVTHTRIQYQDCAKSSKILTLMSRALRLSKIPLLERDRVRWGCEWEGAGWDRDGGARECPPDALGDGCVGDPWELGHRTIGPWETAPQSWRERTGWEATELTSKFLAPTLPPPKLLLGQSREGFCTLQRAVLDSTAERECLPQGTQSGFFHCLFMPLPPCPATA